ncbi:hypothetical protein [Microvirga sesbaniae]|uniref:hypothetical protein n=1 Tax=Microvirga sesbaniae TaxID=681392 RepID=UPI0021C7A6B5|nr:hypothetical protein [Microvirga sp. HBU67692]
MPRASRPSQRLRSAPPRPPSGHHPRHLRRNHPSGAASGDLCHEEIYVTAATLGASVMVALQAAGMEPFLSGAAGFAAAFTLRALPLLRGWSLPAFPRRV